MHIAHTHTYTHTHLHMQIASLSPLLTPTQPQIHMHAHAQAHTHTTDLEPNNAQFVSLLTVDPEANSKLPLCTSHPHIETSSLACQAGLSQADYRQHTKLNTDYTGSTL